MTSHQSNEGDTSSQHATMRIHQVLPLFPAFLLLPAALVPSLAVVATLLDLDLDPDLVPPAEAL